jgi:hypothetical protein
MTDIMRYHFAAALILACTTSAVAQQDTLYGPRGFFGGVRADWVQIIQDCRVKNRTTVTNERVKACVRAEAKRRPVTR